MAGTRQYLEKWTTVDQLAASMRAKKAEKGTDLFSRLLAPSPWFAVPDAPAKDGRNVVNEPGIACQLPALQRLPDQRPPRLGDRRAHELSIVQATLLARLS